MSYIQSGKLNVVFNQVKKSNKFPKIIDCEIKGNYLYIHTDIIGWIIESLTRSEESRVTNNNGRTIPMEESFAYKQGIHQKPYLDQIIHDFQVQFISFLDANKVPWEQIHPSTNPILSLTHDVDSIQAKSVFRYIYWMIQGITCLNIKKIKIIIDRIKDINNLDSDPHFSFDIYKNIEGKFGYKSTFYLLSLAHYLGREGRRYTLKNKKLSDKVRDLVQNGWEIGLHPSRVTHLSQKMLKKEVSRFNKAFHYIGNSIGVRNHYLKAIFPETWRLQELLGFKYDSSLGWAKSPGFRAGTAKPFRPFDIKDNRFLNVWELPLIVMDGAIQGSSSEITDQIIKIAEESFQNYAPLTLLWHSDRISNRDYPEHSAAYQKLLKYFKDRNCIGIPATEVIDLYENYYKTMASHRRRINEPEIKFQND
ncbi:hypothetical protein KKA87_14175 [bacterium]|nr:hypothetical protein [bacterium]MBU1873972.1 hypothetical protein [bacterium]